MAAPTAESASTGGRSTTPFTRLWQRSLEHYPATAPRYAYLAIVVLTTVVLYYQLYVQYAVATSIITHFGMTYRYFVTISVIGNAVGAFASLAAGLADRWGRANMVVFGLLLTALLLLVGLPNAPDSATYLVLFSVVSFVEGVILVATPALIRDFSPQVGRATAMGSWTMGPVLGSLVVTVVTSSTLDSSTWQQELQYSGWAGVLLFVVALLWLRELAPRIRDQIMVTIRDRTLVEARAAGLDPETALKGHWRQMMSPRIGLPALGISIFLLLYYAAVGNLVVFFSTVFGYSEQRANALGNWYWAFNALTLIGIGVISDKLRVRKPLMIIGTVGSIAATITFAVLTKQHDTGYYTFAALFVAIGVLGGTAYAPWMAAFTETVEKRNPAATATGLAVWGWTIRAVVAISSLFLPLVVTSATPLVEHGAQVAAASVKAKPALAVVDAHPALFAQLAKYPPNAIPPALMAQAVQQVGVAGLATVQKAQPELAVLQKYGPSVQKASADAAGQWQTWWWVCVGGQILFLPCAFVLTGRWSPRKARQDEEEHEAAVQAELAALRGTA
ncbi:MFS transporter [Phaeacidiphilus oryzae]|uniref:MFS transporter n=1 Tax=Phaeacidiphilus oryzae TaxID=348818 RepID=UPI00055C7DC7|nr:MFS transporter [Phaeacidiphilus oryzae]